jgi:hypothetical protein
MKVSEIIREPLTLEEEEWVREVEETAKRLRLILELMA